MFGRTDAATHGRKLVGLARYTKTVYRGRAYIGRAMHRAHISCQQKTGRSIISAVALFEMMENARRIKALSRLLAAAVFLTFPMMALSQASRDRPRGAQTKHPLTAEDIARKYLPWVVLIT